MLNNKALLADQIFEKFKSKIFLIQGDFCEETISDLKIDILLEKYNCNITKAISTNIR